MGKNLKGKELGVGFTQRQDGRYECKFTLNGKRKTLYDKNLNDLRKKVNDAKYEIEHGLYRSMDVIKLNDWYDIWLKTYKDGYVKPTTLKNYELTYKKHIRYTIGDLSIKEIKTVTIQTLFNKLYEDNYATSTIHNVMTVLSNLFKFALRDELVIRNPCLAVQIKNKPVKDRRALSLNEQRIFMDKGKNNVYYPIFFMALSTGMRINEILGLTWDNIDFKKGSIYINKNLVWVNGQFSFQDPKTYKGNRTIPMNNELKILLLNHKQKQNVKKVEKNLELTNNLVFVSVHGTPIHYNNVNQSIKYLIKKINEDIKITAQEDENEKFVFENITMHNLRHTFTTRCHEQGIDPKIIQELLGHSSISITMNIYTHPSDELKKEAIEKIKVS